MCNHEVHNWPTVSIIIPIRNEVNFVAQLLDNLLQQDYPSEKVEILVVDGQSDDGTVEIVDRYQQQDPRIRILTNKKRILPSALNLAIGVAQHEVLLKIDGHAEVPHDYVRTSVAILLQHPEAWGVGGPTVHVGKSTLGRAVAVAMSHPVGVGNAKHRFRDFEGYGEGAAFWTFRRVAFERVGLYDESLVRTEDDEFNYRLHRAGGKFFLTPRIQSIYFVRESLKNFAKQYFQYSFWRIPVIRKHRRPTTIRQVVPPLFFIAMFTLAVVGFVLRQPLVALSLPTLYLTTLILTGLSAMPQHGLKVGMLLPIALIVMHASYAAGLIYGAIAVVVFPSAWNQHGKMSQLSR